MADKLIIVAGDVIDVQLTSETLVIEPDSVRHVEQGVIANRMRLFVRPLEGKEQKYDFEDTDLGVRETQRVVIVRGQTKRMPSLANLVLYNLSSGEHATFEQNLAIYLGRKAFFGPLWKAAAFSLGVALVFWFVSNFVTRNGDGGLGSISLAVMFAILTYPVFWWICGVWDRVSERMRYRAARKSFLADMDARARTYARQANAPPPPAQPETPPEASPA